MSTAVPLYTPFNKTVFITGVEASGVGFATSEAENARGPSKEHEARDC